MKRSITTGGILVTLILGLVLTMTSWSAGRSDTLVIIAETGPNSMDIHRTGTNRPSYQVAVNMYDRLVTFGVKSEGSSGFKYDSTSIQPELAESWKLVDDGYGL